MKKNILYKYIIKIKRWGRQSELSMLSNVVLMDVLKCQELLWIYGYLLVLRQRSTSLKTERNKFQHQQKKKKISSIFEDRTFRTEWLCTVSTVAEVQLLIYCNRSCIRSQDHTRLNCPGGGALLRGPGVIKSASWRESNQSNSKVRERSGELRWWNNWGENEQCIEQGWEGRGGGNWEQPRGGSVIKGYSTNRHRGQNTIKMVNEMKRGKKKGNPIKYVLEAVLDYTAVLDCTAVLSSGYSLLQ